MSDWFWKRLNLYLGVGVIVCLFALTAFLASIEIRDLDLWLHLGVGKYILQNQIIPSVDFLSCTIAGKPWINHEWLFQIIVQSIYSIWGVSGLSDLQVFLAGSTVLVLVLLGFTKERILLPSFVMLPVILIFAMRFFLRPDLFSLLFLLIYLYMLSFYLNRRGICLYLFCLQVLWVNIHGFFIFGPLLIVLLLISEVMKRKMVLPFEWNEIGRLSDEELRNLWKTLPLVILACLINPYFLKGAVYPLETLLHLKNDGGVFFQNIVELQRPLSWQNLLVVDNFIGLKFLIVVSLASFVLNFRKIDIGVLFIWVIFLVFSLSAVRNIVFVSVISYLVILANTSSIRSFREIPMRFKGLPWGYLLKAISLVGIMFLIVHVFQERSLNGYYDFDRYERKSEYEGLSLRSYPTKAIDFLIENNIKGNFFNDFNSGAYLIGRTFPNIKVFIDGRTEEYGAEFFKLYQKAWDGKKDVLDEVIEKYNLTGAFISSSQAPAPAGILKYFYHQPDWHLVYFNYDGLVFLKNTKENLSCIKKHNVDLKRWQTPILDLVRIGVVNVAPYQHLQRAYNLYHLEFYDQAKAELMEALKYDQNAFYIYKLLGNIYLYTEDYLLSLENLRKAKLLNPGDIEVRYNLAWCFYYLGDSQKAREQNDLVLSRDSKNTKAMYLSAVLFLKEGRLDLFQQRLEEAYVLSPDASKELLMIAETLKQMKQLDRAKRVCEMVLESVPENVAAKKMLEGLK